MTNDATAPLASGQAAQPASAEHRPRVTEAPGDRADPASPTPSWRKEALSPEQLAELCRRYNAYCALSVVIANSDEGKRAWGNLCMDLFGAFPRLEAALTAQSERLRQVEGGRDVLRDLADSVLFHQLCCLGGCHQSLKALAKLARAIGFKPDPATEDEIESALRAPDESDPTEDRLAKPYECFAEEQRDFKARTESAESSSRRKDEEIAELRRRNDQLVVAYDELARDLVAIEKHLVEADAVIFADAIDRIPASHEEASDYTEWEQAAIARHKARAALTTKSTEGR